MPRSLITVITGAAIKFAQPGLFDAGNELYAVVNLEYETKAWNHIIL